MQVKIVFGGEMVVHMKKILFAFMVSMSMVMVGYCQEQNQPLQLIIKPDKQAFKMGESIKVSYELKNISKDSVLFNKNFQVGNNVLFEYVDEKGITRQSFYGVYWAVDWQSVTGEFVIQLEPKGILQGSFEQILGPTLDDLKKGQWKMKTLLTVSMKSKEGKPELLKLASNTILIEVTER